MDISKPFKWCHFQGEIILLRVRWYLRYPLSYRDLEEMMIERGLRIDHNAILGHVKLNSQGTVKKHFLDC